MTEPEEGPPLCTIGPAPEPPTSDLTITEDGGIIDTPTIPVIYGGEGYGDVKRRHLLVLIALPTYLRDPQHPERGEDLALQGMMLDADIRDAMAKAARKLNDTAMKYSVTGYTWDLDDIVYDIPQARTLSATLVIERA